MTDAYEWVRLNGVMRAVDYPYEAVDNKTCRYNSKKKAGSCSGFVNLPTGSEDELEKAIALIGPVSVGIDASCLSFQFYSEGIFFDSCCSSEDVNHGVLVVGFGTFENQDFWLIKNSWGTSWGGESISIEPALVAYLTFSFSFQEKGFAKLSRNKNNHCGIATMASYPVL